MSKLSLETSVKLARAGAAVERCHAHQNLLRYTVGHHSNDMVTMITLAWLKQYGTLPRAELLVAAAFHDVPERIFGDIPSVVKHLLGPKIHHMEAAVLKAMGVDVELTAVEERWLELADKVELMLWAHEESVTRGNQGFASWVRSYLKKFGDTWNQVPNAWKNIIDLARGATHRDLDQEHILKEVMEYVDQ